MKLKGKTILIMCGVLITAAVAAPVAFSAEPAVAPGSDSIEYAAKIGDKAWITKDEFEQMLGMLQQQEMIRARKAQRPMPAPLTDKQRLTILTQMIGMELLDVLAAEAGFSADETLVEAELGKVKDTAAARGTTFEQVIEQQGMTEDEFKQEIAKTIVRQKFIESKAKEVAVSEEDVLEFYTKLEEAKRIDRPAKTANVAHILVEVPKEADEDAWTGGQKKIDAIRARIVAGEDFAEVAAEASDDPGSKDKGGEYTEIPAGKMVPEFDKRMWELPIDELSEPFRTDFGWHILRVNARHEAGTTMGLEMLRERITADLSQQKMRQKMDELITGAKDRIKVEILIDFEPEPEAETPGSDSAESLLDQSS